MATTPNPTEREIVDGCKRGDRWARRALFDRHHRGLFRFLVAQCGDPSLAEDLVQETFIAAYAAIAEFRADSRVETWMTRIALNRMYAHFRRSDTGRRKLAEIEGGDPRATWLEAERGCDPRSLEMRDLLRRGLERLEHSDATIILLHDLQGLRYREIAEVLDVAIGTVGSRLSRARDRLRTILAEIESRVEETPDHEHLKDSEPEGTAAAVGERRSTLGAILWSQK